MTQFLGSVPSQVRDGLSLRVIENPMKEKTEMYFSIIKSDLVKISLFDELGKEASLLLNTLQEAGTHRIDFDGSKLPAGSYILRLESGGKVISKKIIKE